MKSMANQSMYELCLMHARADRAMRSVVAKKLESQKLTMMEWLALSAIAAGPKEGLSMSSIGETLDVTLPQITALAIRLIDRKLIKQKILDSDHRGRQALATLKGKRTLIKLESSIAKAMREWSGDIPADQMKSYVATISQLAR